MKALNTSFFAGIISTLLWLTVISPAVIADTQIQGNIALHFKKAARDQVNLDIRPIDDTPVSDVSAQLGDVDLPVRLVADYPDDQQLTSILFLVDTSDPGRKQAIEKTISHIEQLLTFSQPHYRYGLARFDTDLHFLTSLGAGKSTIQANTTQLQAVGKTTELYRNTLSAIKQFSRYPADRKFLFLLSDGRAEDRAYFHRDVVQAARQNDISIFTIGYADTIHLTVELQTLRRLSEETGGQYLSAQPGTYQLDQNSLQSMFSSMDLGALYTLNLAPAMEAGIGGTQEIRLSISTGPSLTSAALKIRLPAVAPRAVKKPGPAPEPVIKVTPPPAPQVIIERIPVDNEQDNLQVAWILIGLSMVLLIVIIILLLQLRTRKRQSQLLPSSTVKDQAEDDESAAYAWLETADEHSINPRRFPIRSTDTKIGRYRGNDIALHDSAVSRYHAEIHFTDDGNFVITDMGSKNGILVNNVEVLEQPLSNNDIIEIGDIRLRFVIPDEIAEDLQDTQMFRTQFPDYKSA